MTCSRCQGLIIHAPDEDYCISCGHRPIPVEPQRICKGTRKVVGRCKKSPQRDSDYCKDCERLELAQRKERWKDDIA